jgi:hypothetical protein
MAAAATIFIAVGGGLVPTAGSGLDPLSRCYLASPFLRGLMA